MVTNIFSHVGWHIFARQLDFTACIIKGAIDYYMGAFRFNVLFQLPYFSPPSATLVVVLTSNLLFGARFKTMTLTLELFVAVNASDLNKWTTKALTTRSKVLIEVLVKLSQFPCPLTTITAVGTVHVKLVEGLLQSLVGEGSKQ